MADVYATNGIGTMLTLQTFTDLWTATTDQNSDMRPVCAVISSRLGSIESVGSLGGYTSYRASKAALNMLVSFKCFISVVAVAIIMHTIL